MMDELVIEARFKRVRCELRGLRDALDVGEVVMDVFAALDGAQVLGNGHCILPAGKAA
jgi:hypothetical protein